MARTTEQSFVDNFEVKNGFVGSQDVLNKAVHQVKLELDELWNWSSGQQTTTLPDGNINEYIIDDTVPFGDITVSTQDKVARSAAWIQTNIMNTSGSEVSQTEKGWSAATTYQVITGNNSALGDTVYNGGTWN